MSNDVSKDPVIPDIEKEQELSLIFEASKSVIARYFASIGVADPVHGEQSKYIRFVYSHNGKEIFIALTQGDHNCRVNIYNFFMSSNPFKTKESWKKLLILNSQMPGVYFSLLNETITLETHLDLGHEPLTVEKIENACNRFLACYSNSIQKVNVDENTGVLRNQDIAALLN